MFLLDIAVNFSIVFYISNIFLILMTKPSLTNYKDIFHKTYFLYDQDDDDYSDSSEEEFISKPEIDYTDKYKEEFEKLENEMILYNHNQDNKSIEDQIIEKKQNLKNNILMEASPLGNVIMYYNYDTETFNYYSDHSIPYKYLETIARRYVITYKCKPIFISMEEELKKYEEKLKQDEKTKEENKQDTTNKSNNVFAKFKSYNKDNNINSAKNKKDIPNSLPQKNNNESDKPVLLKENANRFSHQGKIYNFHLNKPPVKTQLYKKSNLSFAEYKKLMQK
jgi:hypothetical protein